MGKFAELSAAFKTIDLALEDIRTAVDDIKESLGEPASEPAVTLEQVRAILAEKSRNGQTAAVRELLQKHGAEKLSAVDPAEYPALLVEAEVL
jgi:hypothetical protein